MKITNNSGNFHYSLILTVVFAAAYPYLLNSFSWSVNQYNLGGEILFSIFALISITMMISIPILSIWALTNISNNTCDNPVGNRTFIYFIVTTPPLYIVTLQIFGWLDLGSWHKIIWIISIMLIALSLQLFKRRVKKHHRAFLPFTVTLKIHRTSAILLIFGFILLHLGNHIFALYSNALHEEVRLLLNKWYRIELIENTLFVLLAFMVTTGIMMLRRYSGTDGNIFRTLQISSGFFIAIFLSAHVNAVLNARSLSVETDWIFATGEYGLINGGGILIPYYIISVAMMLMHISLGIRRVMLARKVNHVQADKTFYGLLSVSAVFTVIISAAILGVKI